jgi:gluconate 2-dehydrogenase gamma chain
MEELSGRRRFLKSVITMGAVGLPAAEESGQSHAHGPTHVAQAATSPSAREPRAYIYLTAPEVAFIDAAVARLIPADELGPGAKEAGVTYFIDQQLFGAYGTMAKQYCQVGGRHAAAGLPIAAHAPRRSTASPSARRISTGAGQYGKTLDELTPDQQDHVLRSLDGTLALGSVPARLFFILLLINTQEGFFADPMYGGTRDKIG